MVKHRLPQICGKAGAGFCGKELSRDAEGQSHQRHENQHQKAPEQKAPVVVRHTDVDHPRHHQRHQQINADLQQLEQRRKDAFHGVPLQIGQKLLHILSLL